jgi:hypothetical protein
MGEDRGPSAPFITPFTSRPDRVLRHAIPESSPCLSQNRAARLLYVRRLAAPLSRIAAPDASVRKTSLPTLEFRTQLLAS